MRFKTSLKLADDKVFPIELDLVQVPIIHIPNETIEQINILDSFYEVREILYRHGGNIEIILHCKNPKIDGVYRDFILLEYQSYNDNLAKLSLKANLPNDGEILLSLYRTPQSKNEYVEKDGYVYKIAWLHLKDDNKNEAVSIAYYELEDFYRLNSYPYGTIQ